MALVMCTLNDGLLPPSSAVNGSDLVLALGRLMRPAG
jgi:predicted xylose isomerase-like sugar epimerase